MREYIKQLEAAAQHLDPDSLERQRLTAAVNHYADDYLEGIDRAPTYAVADKQFPEQVNVTEGGSAIEDILATLAQRVDSVGINVTSGRYLGYIPGGGLFPAALGDYLAAVTNRYAGLFFASPGAVQIENSLLRWMSTAIGYPATASGNLTSGGSIANFTAVVTARDTFDITMRASQAVVYLTAHVHHSIDKALHLAGLSACIKRIIPTDARYRMDAAALDEAIIKDKQTGLTPWLVVASAGTTNTGAVDPLAAIGEIAAAHGLWFHIDGSYGGLFVLCPEAQEILKGTERSDSMTVDPHKTLFLPYGTGTVLIKDRQKHVAAFNAEADYMQNILDDVGELSPADLSPELTKHFRGLRLWLPLKLFGVEPFRAALSEKIHLARYFYEQIRQVDGFEVGAFPDLSIVTYRYRPQRGDIDAFNQKLLRTVQHDGQVFVSGTRVDNQFVLRAAILSFRTHLDDVDMALDVLKTQAQRLENEG